MPASSVSLAALFTMVMFMGGMISTGIGGENSAEARARRFVARYEAEVKPLEIETARCWWDANISGSDADYQRKEAVETRLELKLADPQAFAELKALEQSPIGDPILAREIQVLYREYLDKQVDPDLLKQMLALSNKIEKAFNLHRPQVAGKELTDNEVREILQKSADSAQRRAVWQSSKAVGEVVAPDLKQLVKLRNQVARKLGFRDFHVLQLYLNEQSQEQVLKLFDELDELTRVSYRQAKQEIDALLAQHCGIRVEELRPWHYHDPFCQEAPAVLGNRNEALFKKLDILKLCREFYGGIGMPIDDVLARSDLYEKKGKNPHAFCTDIDRNGDVRVLGNVVPNQEWLSTMLHELGHSIYSSKNIPPSVPYVLRGESHVLTTEGIAMMFETFGGSAEWLQAMGVEVPDPQQFNAVSHQWRRNKLLFFSRWCQVMLRFEKELYGNPDQDLNRLWWDLVEKYQEIRRPEGRNAPDYAAKIHIVIAPAYYHNYMLGQLFASQVHHALVREMLGNIEPTKAIYVGNKAAGNFIREKVFVPGRTLSWNELTRHATGAELNPKAFAADIAAQ
jgi:peptidyl-dipeptidase A